MRRVRLTTVSVEKRLSITYFERVSITFVIQHAQRMCRIILSSVICTIFFTLSHKRHDSREKKKIIKHKMYILIFSTRFSETLSILRIITRNIITNVHRSTYKVPVILVKF